MGCFILIGGDQSRWSVVLVGPGVQNPDRIKADVENSATMPKAGDEIQPHEPVDAFLTHRADKTLIEKHRGVGRDSRVSRTVDQQQLSARRSKGVMSAKLASSSADCCRMPGIHLPPGPPAFASKVSASKRGSFVRKNRSTPFPTRS